MLFSNLKSWKSFILSHFTKPASHHSNRRRAWRKSILSSAPSAIEQLEDRLLLAADIVNWPVSAGSIPFGESSYAYVAQSFVAETGYADQLTFQLTSSTGPDDTEFRVLIAHAFGTSSNPLPHTVLFESDTLVKAAGSGSQEFTVDLNELKLSAGASYVWMLDSAIAFDGLDGTSRVGLNSNYQDGHLMVLNAGSKSRDINFRQTWQHLTAYDMAFQMTFSDTGNSSPQIDLNDWEEFGIDLTASFTENQQSWTKLTTLASNVYDPDGNAAGNDVLSSLTVTITNLLDGSDEHLYAPTLDTNISSNYDPATGVLTLTGNDTAANYSRILKTLWYKNESENPDTTTRVIELVASDGEKLSNTAKIKVAVIPQNDAPTIDLNGASQVGTDFITTFTENTGPVSIFGTAAEIVDLDGGISSSAVSGSGDVYTLSTDGIVKRINLTTYQVTDISDGTLIQNAREIAIDPTTGYLFVTDYAGMQIVRIDPKTGEETQIASGFAGWGIEVDSAGNLIVADVTNKQLVQIDPQTGNQTVLSTLNFTPGDLAIDADGDIAVTSLSDNGIVLHPGMRSQAIIEGGQYGEAFNKITIDAVGNFIATARYSGSIYQIDSQTGDSSSITAASSPSGVAVDSFNNIVVTELGTGQIFSFDRATATRTDIFPAQSNLYGVVVDTAVFKEGLTTATIKITNLLDGSNEQLLIDTSGTNIVAAYNETTGTLSLTGDDSVENYRQVLRTIQYNNNSESPDTTDRIIEFVVSDGIESSNTATTTVSVISVNDPPVLDLNGVDEAGIDYTTTVTTNAGPISITDSDMRVVEIDGGLYETAFVYEGKIYALDFDGRVVQLDPSSGDQTLISDGSLLQSGQHFALNPLSGHLFIADFTGRQIVKVDLSTGLETQLIANITPGGIAFDQNGNLFFTNLDDKSIYQADPVTGALTLFSTTSFYMEHLVIDSDGSFLVTNRQSELLVRNPGLANQEIVSQFGVLGVTSGMAVDEVTGDIYLTGNANGGFIVKVAPTSGNQSTVISGVGTYRISNGIAGDFFIINSTVLISTFNTDTGTITPFSSGNYITRPQDLIVEQEGSTPLGSLVSATVSITNLQNGTDELLETDTSDTNILANYDPITGTLNLTGEDTAENYRLVLSRITYENLSQTPDFTDRIIEFVIDDGLDSSTIAKATINYETIPVANAGGPYVMNEGQQLALDATGSYDLDGDALSFAWDLNNDGIFSDATGVAPTLTWSQLVDLGVDDDGTYLARVQVDDGNNSTVSEVATITINNVAPSNIIISNPLTLENAGAEGESNSFSFSFEDPGSLDEHTILVNWGDGSSETFVLPVGDRGFTIDHTYDTGGIFEINTMITDDDTGSDSATTTAYVSGVGIVIINGENVLQIVGTSGNDSVEIKKYKKSQFSVKTTFNSEQVNRVFSPTGIDRMEALLGAGNDEMSIDRFITIPVLIDAGSGDDIVKAGGGSAIILGGAGNDILTGSLKNDLIFGGLGNDELKGNSGDDLIFGGIYSGKSLPGSINDDREELLAAQSIWSDSSQSIEDRKSDIEGLDNFYTRLIDDGELDSLHGNRGQDWYLPGSSDLVRGFSTKKGDVK